MKHILTLFLLLCSSLCFAIDVPPLAPVIDMAEVLSASDKQQIDSRIRLNRVGNRRTR